MTLEKTPQRPHFREIRTGSFDTHELEKYFRPQQRQQERKRERKRQKEREESFSPKDISDEDLSTLFQLYISDKKITESLRPRNWDIFYWKSVSPTPETHKQLMKKHNLSRPQISRINQETSMHLKSLYASHCKLLNNTETGTSF